MVKPHDLVVSLYDVDHDDRYYVGDQTAILGKIGKSDFSVLPGFVVTSAAYFSFLAYNNLPTKIRHLLGAINYDRDDSVSQISQYVKKLIKTSHFPEHLIKEIHTHYNKIGNSAFSIQSALISGDHEQSRILEDRILSGHIGDAVLLDSIRSFWSTLFTEGLILHRNKNGIDHLKTGLSTTIQKAIIADLVGKVKASDSILKNNSQVVIELPTGDELLVDKNTYEISTRKSQAAPSVFVVDGKIINAFEKLGKSEAILLSKIAQKINDLLYFPQEVLWAKSGNNLYITGVRPATAYGKN